MWRFAGERCEYVEWVCCVAEGGGYRGCGARASMTTRLRGYGERRARDSCGYAARAAVLVLRLQPAEDE
jgi:hypothetical protein